MVMSTYKPGSPGGMLPEVYREFQEVSGSSERTNEKMVALAEWLIDTFVFSAYIGLWMTTPTSISDIGTGTWRWISGQLDETDSARGITFDGGNAAGAEGYISIDNPGVYQITSMGSMSHNSSNDGRIMYFRFDGDMGIGTEYPIGTGRNAEVTNWNLTRLVEVGPEETFPYSFRLRVGSQGDTYTGVVLEDQSMSVTQVGVWQGADPLEGM